MDDWEAIFETEMARAEQARRAGNPGMARVCARRAAGRAAGEYLRRAGMATDDPSAYDQLRALARQPGLPPAARQAVERLMLRVTPEFSLPAEVDLLAEARVIRQLALDTPPT